MTIILRPMTKRNEAQRKKAAAMKEAARSRVLELHRSGVTAHHKIAKQLKVSLRIVRDVLVEAGLHEIKERGW
ncbi:hypothetical protein [Pseudomonas sp. zfem005]|uniref:hypothetical protein n=1 Tax=Pseudomonas sp. zfem005 TaxID=3078200 RepID=UPI002927E60F|nr:hypothetical protein [Pseudomonas sp. zfem005]MDU9416202.1 hypothetical protein [Pseudomonas sp. zfem005]